MMTNGEEHILSMFPGQGLYCKTNTKMTLDYWQKAQWVASQVVAHIIDGDTDPLGNEY